MNRTITDRVDAVTGMTDEQHSPTPPIPKACKIELTSRCNFKCAYCATSQGLRPKGDMDKDFFRRVTREMREAGVEELGLFFLGESFVCDWLEEACDYAKNEVGYPYVFLTTNGSMADPYRVRDLMKAGLDSLKFSLNYADAKQFTEIARVNSRYWDEILRNIDMARWIRDRGGFDCGLFGSYIAYDGEQGERMKALVDRVSPYLDEVYALPLYSQADLTGQDNAGKGWDVRAGNPGRAENMRQPVPCWSVFTEARITFDGRLAACCFDHRGEFEMGDLNVTPFAEAWSSDKFQELRSAHLKKDLSGTPCEACVAYN